jgi:hypothetical protein
LRKRLFGSRGQIGGATMHDCARAKRAKEALGGAHDPLEGQPQRRDEDNEHGVRRLSRRAVTEERSHHEPKIQRCI